MPVSLFQSTETTKLQQLWIRVGWFGACESAVHVHEELFSVRTSSRDDRCFVLKEGDFWICLHPECKNLRAMYEPTN